MPCDRRAQAIVVNVTAIAPSRGDLPHSVSRGRCQARHLEREPAANQIVANLVEVAIGTGGQIDVYNNLGTINVAVDVEGYVSTPHGRLQRDVPRPESATRAQRVAASRQTSATTGGRSPIAANGALTFNVNAIRSPVPATGVTAVVFNLTAIDPSSAHRADRVRQGTDEARCVEPQPQRQRRRAEPRDRAGATRLRGDVHRQHLEQRRIGQCRGRRRSAGSRQLRASQFTALATPARVCDTQNGKQRARAARMLEPLARVGALNIDVTGIDGDPCSSAHAHAGRNRGQRHRRQRDDGNLCHGLPGPIVTTAPNASDLNVADIRASHQPCGRRGLDRTGTINLFNDLGNVNLIVDVFGYYS